MEILAIYDENKEATGETFVRGEKPERGYYLVAQLILFNSAGQMLIQQRASGKERWPDLWDISCGGAVLAGETSREAAMRECREELGLEIDLTGQRPRVSVSFPEGYTDVYLAVRDLDPAKLTLQAEEVQAARFASESEIRQMIDDGRFFPYYKSWISYLFESRGKYGSYDLDRLIQ